MKIVRVVIAISSSKFYFDRPYDEKFDKQVNCNDALTFLSNQIESKKSLAVMAMGQGLQRSTPNGDITIDPFYKAQPAILNLNNISLVIIENVGVYDLKEESTNE